MIAGYFDILQLLGIFMSSPAFTPPEPGAIPYYQGLTRNVGKVGLR